MQWQQRGDGDKSHDGDDIRDHDRNLLDIDEVEVEMVLVPPSLPYQRKVKLFWKPHSTPAWNTRTGRGISPNMARLI